MALLASSRSSRLRLVAAASVLSLAGLVANACSLNPQPLPPDAPIDSGARVNGAGPGVDSGGGKGGAPLDATTTPAQDSGGMFTGGDTAVPVTEDAGPDSAESVDGALDGEADGSNGDARSLEGGPSEGGEDGEVDGGGATDAGGAMNGGG